MNYLQFLNNEEFWIFGSKVRQEDVKTENLGGPLVPLQINLGGPQAVKCPSHRIFL